MSCILSLEKVSTVYRHVIIFKSAGRFLGAFVPPQNAQAVEFPFTVEPRSETEDILIIRPGAWPAFVSSL